MTRRRSARVAWWKGVVGALTAALFTPSTTPAQTVQERRAQLRAQICDMSYKMLTVQVVDANDAPVPGVRLHIEGLTPPGDTQPDRLTSTDGRAQVAEDSDLQRLPAKGATYMLRMTKGAKVRRVRIRLGRDEAGCHIALIKGSSTIRF